jgi:Leucine-rich repeat (LRR) protein
MQKLLFFISILSASYTLQGQIVNVPDANFKNHLVNINCVDNDGDGFAENDVDTNDDGEIQVSEAQFVINLIIQGPLPPQIMSTLEGIESFSNLESVSAANGHTISHADYSQNLSLKSIFMIGNQVNTIILPQSPNLTELIVWGNNLTDIDVSQNPNLEQFQIYDNELTTLDVTQNPNLIRLVCGFNNLTSLDLTQNPNLERLDFSNNQITDIDITQNPQLSLFACHWNQIENLDLSQHQFLEEIRVHHNELTSLNIKNGNNTNLENMIAYENPNLFCIEVDNQAYADNQICDLPFIGWCKDVNTNYNEQCTLGIDKFNTLEFSLLPNPADNFIEISSKTPLDNIECYSLNGNKIFETINTRIDISNLSSGIYIIAITQNKKKSFKKFVKY